MIMAFEEPTKTIGTVREVDLSDNVHSRFNDETTDFVHLASGKTLHIPSYVIPLYHLDKHSLDAIATSPLPIESIKAFAESLFQSCPATHSVLESTWEGFDLVTATSKLAHVIHLYTLAGIELGTLNDRFQEMCLQLEPPQLADAIVMIWTICDRDDTLLRIAANCMRPHWDLFMARADEWKEIASCDMARFIKLVAQICGMKMTGHGIKIADTPMCAKLKELERTLVWRKKPFETGSTHDIFSFCIAGRREYIDVRGWVIHPQWKYFAKMVSSGLNELKTRVVTLPSHFPRSLLVVLLKYLHIRSFDLSSIYPFDTAFLDSHGTEFYLTELDHTPIPPFEPIVNAVLGKVAH